MLIGFMGIKGSGKDTCADYLVENYCSVELNPTSNDLLKKKSFADPLKKACRELFLFTNDQLYGTQTMKETPDPRWFGCTPRLALQYVGTDLLRDQLDKIMPELGKDIFTHHFRIWYEEEKKKNPNTCVLISDVRFQNEIDLIHSLGGIVIKLERPEVTSNDLHPSEIELQQITTHDYVIHNTGTKDQLYKELDNCLKNHPIHKKSYSYMYNVYEFLNNGWRLFHIW